VLINAFNRIEPPWYGPVCLVVWEGGSCEVPPYPDLFCMALLRRPLTLRPLKRECISCRHLVAQKLTYRGEGGNIVTDDFNDRQ
jgi:hypothetical protein